MRWPLVSRRRHNADLEAVKADRERIRSERNQFEKDRDAHRAAANTASRQYAELDEKYIAVCIVNNHLTEDLVKAAEDLAASRRVEGSLARQIHAMAQPVEPTDEHMDELNRLLAELHAEKARADRLQRRLDDAVGLASPRPLDSSVWQPGYVAPKPDKETTS